MNNKHTKDLRSFFKLEFAARRVGTATGTGTGGCTFNGDVTITHGGTLTYFTLANTNGDTFNGNVTFTNNSNRELYVATNGSTQFNGNVILNSTSTGGILFGNGTGTSSLASGKTISIGTSGFAADFLTLKNFTQSGSTAQSLTLTGSAAVNMIGVTFNGNLTVSAPGFLMKNSVFNGTSSFTKTGTGNHQSDGGNTFNGATTIAHTGASGRIRMATITGDTYNADATFNSSGQDVQIAYLGNNSFTGNITINSNKVVFNTSTGKVTFTGTNNQTLNGSYHYPFKKLSINKTSGTVTANTTLSVDDSLIFIQGNLITTSTNLLTMKHGSSATGASNTSFVSGPVKKVGNTAFSFPVGKQNGYLPLEISAPATTTSEFVAEYKLDTIDVHTIDRDASLGFVFRDRYWTLSRTSGTSNVYVTLSWNDSYHLEDSLITTCFWNGSMWKDQGSSNATGSDSLGTMRTASTQSSFAEFTLGYKSYTALGSNALNCQHIQSQALLKWCLVTGNPNCIVTGNINLVQSPVGFLSMPMPVYAGVHLKGFNDVANTDAKWWEAGCPLLTSNNRVTYDPNQVKQMFVFELYEGGVIENLKLRGPDCNFRDFNGDNLLSGGIFAVNYGNLLSAKIESCEISCFSYAGVFKGPTTKLMEINNSYIHKVKANGHTTGIGYGVWSRSIEGTSSTSHFANVIFDDCKAATDGQGRQLNSNHDHCTFTQFFVSEDVNLHNTDGPEQCFTPNSSCGWPNDCFYGYACTPCNTNCITNEQVWIDCSNPFSILDIGGESSIFTNCIFHKIHSQSLGQSNITLPFPKYNDADKAVKIENSVFATPLYAPEAFMSQKNRGGFARVADNYINSCVYSGFFTNISNNTFGYKPETSTLFVQPKEFSLELFNNNGTQPLPYTYNFSATRHRQKIQSVDLNTSFKVVATPGPYGGNQFYIFRPNPNSGSAGTNGVLSKNNYFYQDERYSGNGTWTYTGYDKPGLYGIDVLAMDVTASEFNASRWEHIPVIVKPSAQTDPALYFNIKDSYSPLTSSGWPPLSTGIKKRASLNGFPIWEEDIQDGGDGWEYVVVPLTGNVLGTNDPILSKLNMNGIADTITFSIVFDPNAIVSTLQYRGVLVWVDDVYIPKSNYTNGDNLIEDGTIELSDPAAFAEEPSTNSYWFQSSSHNLGQCIPLRVLSGAEGQDQLDEEYTFVDGSRSPYTSNGPLYAEAGITSVERKSGSKSLLLKLPAISNTGWCAFYNVNNGNPVISASTLIDFTDLIPCSSYTSNPFNFTNTMPCSSPTPLTNERYLIDSDVTLCGNLTLVSCHMALTPGVKIIVPNGATLTIENDGTNKSSLFACDEMWQGIIVEDGGTLIINGYISGITLRHCRISDAVAAISCPGNTSGTFNPTLRISTVDFLNNLIAIDAENVDLQSAQIRGCNFNATTGMLTKIPNQGVYPQHHVRLENVSAFTLGLGSSISANQLNEFGGISMGIFANESSLSVFASEFDNLMNYSISPPQKGIGINAQNSTSTPRTLEVDSRFRNLHRGIFTRGNFDVNIHDCDHFRDIDETAISINSMNYDRTITINNNPQFQRCNIGIRVSGGKLNSLNISNNELDNTDFIETNSGSFHNTAITVQKWSSTPASTGVVEVFNNQVIGYRMGIHALNVTEINIGTNKIGTLIAGNTIEFKNTTFPLTDFHEGIWLQNCTGAKVANNYVFNSATNEDLNFRGIDIESSLDCFLNCNEIDNIGVAINIFDNCGTTKLRSNTMSHFFTGVWLNGPNGASVDVDQGNASTQESWGNVWNWLAAPSLKVDGGGFGGTQFNWYHIGADATGNPLSPRPWNANIIQPEPATGTAGSLCTSFFRTTPNRQDNFGPVVGDSAIYAESEDNSRYLATQNSYIAMKTDSTLIYRGDSLDTDFESFFLSMDSSNVGKFQKVKELATTWPDSAQVINSSIVDTNDIEYNLKTFNALYFGKLIDGTPVNSSDSTFLEGLLYGSAITEGESFFNAAAVQSREVHPESYSLRLGNSAVPEITEQLPVPVSFIKIFPNPANNSIKVEVLNADDKIIRIELYSSLGNLIATKTCDVNLIEMDIHTYIDGLYKLRAFTTKGFSDTKTINIVR